MTSFKDWLKSLVSEDSRKASRRKTPPLVAYFWDGGQPVAHPVQNISPTGFYLTTDQRWLLGTLIMMTLQRTSSTSDLPDCSVIIMSKVIRYGGDGVGFAFIPVETASPGQQPGPGAHAADKKTLEKFLHLLKSDSGYVLFEHLLLYLLFPLLFLAVAVPGLREVALVLGLLIGTAHATRTRFARARR